MPKVSLLMINRRKQRKKRTRLRKRTKRKRRPRPLSTWTDCRRGSWRCRLSRGKFKISLRARRAKSTTFAGRRREASPPCCAIDLKKREEETLAEGIDEFQISADRKKLLYAIGGAPDGPTTGLTTVGIVDAGKFSAGAGALNLGAISVRVEPRAEWAEMLREAWRINRDYFYATNMHGADWNAMRRKYEDFVPHLATRDDLNRVMRMMLSELAVGHSFLGGGERLYEPKVTPVGLLGADYEVVDGRFRFKKIYGGAYWDSSLRALSPPPVLT